MKTTIQMRAIRSCKPNQHEATIYSLNGEYDTFLMSLPETLFSRIFRDERLTADINVDVATDDKGERTFAFAGLVEDPDS